MAPSRSTAPGSVLPSRVHPPVTGECEKPHGSHKGTRLTTMSEEIRGLRGTARRIRASKVICAPDDIIDLGAYIITRKVGVYETCVENECGSNPFRYGNRGEGRMGILFHERGRTGTLGRFDVRKRYTLGFHLFPIDNVLIV